MAEVRRMLRRLVDGEQISFNHAYRTVYDAVLCWPDRPPESTIRKALREAAHDAMALLPDATHRRAVAESVFLKYADTFGSNALRATPSDIARLVAKYTPRRDFLRPLCGRDLGAGAGVQREWASALARWRAGHLCAEHMVAAGRAYADWKADFARAELARLENVAELRRIEAFLERRSLDF